MRISDWSSDVCSSDLNLMNKFKWGGLETGNIYIDPETRRMLGYFRLTFNQLADTLYKQGKIDSCVKVIDRMNEVLHDIYSDRSEERRVGKECVSTCRSWCPPYN